MKKNPSIVKNARITFPILSYKVTGSNNLTKKTELYYVLFKPIADMFLII